MDNFNSDMIYVALFLIVFLVLIGIITLVEVLKKTKFICSLFNLHEKKDNVNNKNHYECRHCGSFIVLGKIKDRKGR